MTQAQKTETTTEYIPFLNLTARDVMTPVGATVAEDATLDEIAALLSAGSAEYLLVVDGRDRGTGVIGTRQVARAHRLAPRTSGDIRARELDFAPWVPLTPADDLPTCAGRLVERDLDAVPVLDPDGRVLGLVTARSILEAAADELPPPNWLK